MSELSRQIEVPSKCENIPNCSEGYYLLWRCRAAVAAVPMYGDDAGPTFASDTGVASYLVLVQVQYVQIRHKSVIEKITTVVRCIQF